MPGARPCRGRWLCGAALAAVLAVGARAEETVVEFVVVRADTLVGPSNSVLVSPTAWREVARINSCPTPTGFDPASTCASPLG